MTYVENKRKELRRDYPFEKGLTIGTQTQEGRQMKLIPQGKLGVSRTVLKRYDEGL